MGNTTQIKKVNSTKTISSGNKTLSTNSNQKATRIVKIVGVSLIFAALLFMFIGFFGDVYGHKQVTDVGTTTTIAYKSALDFFFKDGWNEIIRGTEFSGKGEEIVSKMNFILLFLSYITLLCSTIVSIVFSIIRGVKFYSKKDQNVKFNLFVKLALFASLAYVVLNGFTNYACITTKLDSQSARTTWLLGWGSALVLVGAIIMAASSILLQYNGEKGKLLSKFITKNVVLVLIVFVIAFGFNAGLWYGQETDLAGKIMKTTAHTNIWALITSQSEYKASWLVLILIALLMMVAMIVLSFMVFTSKDYKQMTIYVSVLLGLAVLAAIFSSIGVYQWIESEAGTHIVGIGWSFLLDIAFLIISLILVSVSRKLKVEGKTAKVAPKAATK